FSAKQSEPNLGFVNGQKAATDWLDSLPEYQDFLAKLRLSLRELPPPPNNELSQYLFGLLDQRVRMITDSPSDGYRDRLLKDWKSDLGENLHDFFHGFVFQIYGLVLGPIWYLLRVAYTERALKALWNVLNPVMARYRRLLQQVGTDPILKSSPAIKDLVYFFYQGALFTLNNCAPTMSAFSTFLTEAKISKPIDSPPHKQEVFDKMLVSLVDYLRTRVPDPDGKESKIFVHVSKILSLTWGPQICPDKPKMWRERYRRATA